MVLQVKINNDKTYLHLRSDYMKKILYQYNKNTYKSNTCSASGALLVKTEPPIDTIAAEHMPAFKLVRLNCIFQAN